MKYYFVDYENVHSEGFIGIDGIAKNDTLYLMYTEQCKTFSLEVLEKIVRRKINLEIYKVGSGSKNALDFQLSSFMGYIIAKNEEKECYFYIVSKDTGFDHLIDFWRKKGISVERICNFSPNPRAVKSKATKPQPNPQPASPPTSAPPAKSSPSVQTASPQKFATPAQNSLNTQIIPPTPPIPSLQPLQSLQQSPSLQPLQTVIPPQSVSAEKTEPTEKSCPAEKHSRGRTKKTDINKATKEELMACLSDEEYSDGILEIINSYKSKVSIKNALDKQFRDSQKSSAIYKKLKSLFKDKKKT